MLKFISFYILLPIVLSCTKNVNEAFLIDKPVPLENTSNREWKQGWLSVAENRSNPQTRFIELPFIWSKAPDSINVQNPPFLIMSGGPGNSSIHMANGTVYSPLGKNSDLIVMDQRGTFYAKPNLQCPEVDSLRILGIRKGLSGKKLDSLHFTGVELCYKNLKSQNVDFNGYNTLESVEDIEDLRKLLQIEKLILYGMSYSCKLMAAYAQTYPEHVEALILDSPLPHEANYDEEAYANMDNTLKSLIEFYGGPEDLYKKWNTYIGELKESVLSIQYDNQDFTYTSTELVDVILGKMSDHSTLTDVVPSIQKIIKEDHDQVKEIFQSYLQKTRQAKAMRYAVWISEELPDEDPALIEIESRKYKWLSNYLVNDISFQTTEYFFADPVYNTKSWPNSIYNGPVFILSGQFDPWTPVKYGKTVAQNFPNSMLKIYPELTHLPGFTRKGAQDIYSFIKDL